MRSIIVAAGALLVAGVAGLVTVEAQPGRGRPAPVKITSVKQVPAVQKELNTVLDGLISLGNQLERGAPGRTNLVGATIVNEKVYRDFIDKTVYKSKPGGLKLKELVSLRKDLNTRFNSMIKAGKLTSLDQKILAEGSLAGMNRMIRGGR